MKNALRILIVEDDIIDRKLLERLLAQSSLGTCEVENADRLAGALERLQSQSFDIVLLDLGLPDSQGMESVVRLQAQAPQTPIIVLSGLDDANVATQAVQIGVQDYLIKGQVDATGMPSSLCRCTPSGVKRLCVNTILLILSVRLSVLCTDLMRMRNALISISAGLSTCW